MSADKTITLPEWARNATLAGSITQPHRWVACSQCGGSGLVPGRVGGYDMMCSCPLCMCGGGRFELT